jgi:hypothetical protein
VTRERGRLVHVDPGRAGADVADGVPAVHRTTFDLCARVLVQSITRRAPSRNLRLTSSIMADKCALARIALLSRSARDCEDVNSNVFSNARKYVMNQRKKIQIHDKPASIRVLGRQELQEVIGGSVRITGTDDGVVLPRSSAAADPNGGEPRPDNRDF